MQAARRAEDAVTPALGTALILAIAVAGTAAALYFGGPFLASLQDQGALDSVTGQFEDTRIAMEALGEPGSGVRKELDLPRGTLERIDGTSWLVAFGQDPDPARAACDLRVAWTEGAVRLTVTAAGCRAPVDGPQAACVSGSALADPTRSCLEVWRHDGAAATRIGLASVALPNVDLAAPIAGNGTYRFALTNGATAPTTYAEAWLLRGDALHWRTSDIAADLDGGIVVAHGRAQDVAVSRPRLDDGDGAGPVLLVLPTWTLEGPTAISGGGTRVLDITLESSAVRHGPQDAVRRVRIDVAGPNARPLCEAFVARDGLAWSADAPCADADDSGLASVAASLGGASDAHVVLTQPQYTVRIRS